MTTRTLTGAYPAGYTLKPVYSALTLTTTAQVGGVGIVANALATVTNSGAISAAVAAAGTAQHSGILLSAGGEVVNLGAVAGGQGSIGVASSGYDGEPGGEGVDIASGSITNHASITGGQGGAAGKNGGYGGSGGNGVYLSGIGSVTNAAGTIKGGAGGSGALSVGGAGLCSLAYTQLANSSGIVGGAAGGGHGGYGIEFLSGASVNNIGTVLGGAGAGVYRGGPGAYVLGGGTIDNSGEIMGGAGGVISPGGASSASGVIVHGQAALNNTGTVAGGSGALGAGIILQSGGTITNGGDGHTTALICGYNGVQLGGLGTLDNFATIEATGGKGAYGLVMNDGGSVTNYKSGLISGYGGVELAAQSAPFSAAFLTNDGTIKGAGAAAGYGLVLGAGNTAVNGSDTYKTALVEGWTGALVAGSATLTNYGTIEGGASGVAVSLAAPTATLAVEADSAFEGQVLGGGGTLVLASGVGTISGLAGGDLTVSASMPTTTFDDFDTLDIASGAKFTLSGNGSLASVDSLADEGLISVTGTLSVAGGLSTTGTLSGAGTLAVIAGGVADLDGGTALTIAKVTQSGATSDATIGASSLGYAGLWKQTGGTLSVGAGDQIGFSGSGNSFAGTLAGAGTVNFTAGSDTLSGATLSVANTNVTGASVTLSGTIADPSVVTMSGHWLVGSGGATLSGAGAVLLYGTAGEITGATSTSVLTVDSRLEGWGQLGGGNMELVIGATGTIDSREYQLDINTGTTTINNQGYITCAGAGPLSTSGMVIDSPLENTGYLVAYSSTLEVEGVVAGPGHVEVENTGTLIFEGAFNGNVTFTTGSTGTLELGDSKGYTTGAITGFSTTGANTLDLLDIAFAGTTTGVYSGTTTSGVLTVTEGANVAKIHLTGDYLGSTFTLFSGPSGSTNIIDPPKAASPLQATAPLSPLPFIAAMAGFGAPGAASVGAIGDAWRTAPLALAMPGRRII